MTDSKDKDQQETEKLDPSLASTQTGTEPLSGADSDKILPFEKNDLAHERDADFSQLDDLGGQERLRRVVAEGAEKEIASLTERTQDLMKECESFKDKYLRALAEMENYKKRSLKERSDLLKYQGESILRDFLSIADNFERANEHINADEKTLRQGIELISKDFFAVLKKWDVRGESAIGKAFDPSYYGALAQVPTADCIPGTIINELRKAYFYKDKLLRSGEVVVSAAMPESKPESGEDALNEDVKPDGGNESGS